MQETQLNGKKTTWFYVEYLIVRHFSSLKTPA